MNKFFASIAALSLACTLPEPDPELGQAAEPFIGDVSGNPNPLTFWWYAGDPTALRPMIECALERIRAATCLPVDVSLDAAHWVRQKSEDAMGGRSGWTTGSRASTRIAILDGLDGGYACHVLTHEIAQHVLRPRNDHAPGTMFNLHESLLEEVCAYNDCPCFVPEPPGFR